MFWIVYALIGVTIWSATAVADRFLLVQHVQSKRFYVAVPAILQFLLVLILSPFFHLAQVSFPTICYALLSGISEAVFLYYMFVAVSNEEVSRIFSLTSVGPIITLIFGALFLGEVLTKNQFIAFGLFIAGGFLLAVKFGDGKESFSLSRGIKPLLFGSALTSGFTLLLRFVFTKTDFWTGFFYSRLGFFLAGLVILFIWRKEIVLEWQHHSRKVRWLIIGNQTVAFSGHLFYFLAISLASAALVQSVLGIQSAIVLAMALIVSYWNPNLIHESLERKDIIQKIGGVVLVILATYVLAHA